MTKTQRHTPRRKTGPAGPLIEVLAAIEHEQWSLWAQHMLANATPANRRRWRRQLATPYAELTEAEKEKDRVFARKVLGAVAAHLAATVAEPPS